MSHRIDNQMMQIYNRCTQGSSASGNKVSQQEAMQLIKRAEEINSASTSSYSSETKRGNKYLLHLMDDHKSHFSDESKQLIQKYIRTGKVPSMTGGGQGHGGAPVSGGHGHGGAPVSGGDPSRPSVPAPGGNPSRPSVPAPGGGPSHPSDPAAGGVGGGSSAGGIGGGSSAGGGSIDRPSTPTTPSTPVGGGNVGTVGPHGTMILDFTATKPTWSCHWFPMQETRPGGDATNNLYAVNGPLDKLDAVTGGSARQYEYTHNRKAVDAGKEYGWWGHCNNASESACILQEPKHSVVMTARDGSQVKFTRNDIQGLLVKCSSSLVTKVDFKGERFNVASRDNPNDPLPAYFMQVMKEWASDGLPFVLDIDRGEQVWNFPYDSVKMYESDEGPAGSDAPSGSKFYHIEMQGSGYPEKARVYECWVAPDGSSGWIKTPNTHNNPDFMWRPHPVGDITDKSVWQLRGRPSNPEIDMQMVYEIYMKSLS